MEQSEVVCKSCYGAGENPCCNSCTAVRIAFQQSDREFIPWEIEQCKRADRSKIPKAKARVNRTSIIRSKSSRNRTISARSLNRTRSGRNSTQRISYNINMSDEKLLSVPIPTELVLGNIVALASRYSNEQHFQFTSNIIITVGAWSYRGAVFNWIRHMKHHRINNYIVLCLDENIFKLIDEFHKVLLYQNMTRIVQRIEMNSKYRAAHNETVAVWQDPCTREDKDLDSEMRTTKKVKNSKSKRNESKTGCWGRQKTLVPRASLLKEINFRVMLVAKYAVINKLLHHKHIVIWSDTDAVWLRDCASPLHWIMPEFADILGQKGLSPVKVSDVTGACLCTGFFMIKPTLKSRLFMADVVKQLQLLIHSTSTEDDQAIVNKHLLEAGAYRKLIASPVSYGRSDNFEVQFSDYLPSEQLVVGFLPYSLFPRAHLEPSPTKGMNMSEKTKYRVSKQKQKRMKAKQVRGSSSKHSKSSGKHTPRLKTEEDDMTLTHDNTDDSTQPDEDTTSLDQDSNEEEEEAEIDTEPDATDMIDTEEEEDEDEEELLQEHKQSSLDRLKRPPRSRGNRNTSNSSLYNSSSVSRLHNRGGGSSSNLSDEEGEQGVEWRRFSHNACLWHMLSVKSGHAKLISMKRDLIWQIGNGPLLNESATLSDVDLLMQEPWTTHWTPNINWNTIKSLSIREIGIQNDSAEWLTQTIAVHEMDEGREYLGLVFFWIFLMLGCAYFIEYFDRNNKLKSKT